MDQTLRNIIDIIEQIGQNHLQLNDVSGGDVAKYWI